MKNQKLKRLLEETMASVEKQPHDDITFLNQDELNQLGGGSGPCTVNFCQGYGNTGCGNNMCNQN